MRVVVLGLGLQGQKRITIAGDDVIATVDPVVTQAEFRTIEQVPPDSFDAALVCTPDSEKIRLLRYLFGLGKHVLVEKPLLAADGEQLRQLANFARAGRVACYTAYNHRFEPNVTSLKKILDSRRLGALYFARLFYGNGTALDVKGSPWRDRGGGVLADLGSHLLDMALFLFGRNEGKFEMWSANRFENRAFDHALFGRTGRPTLEFEVTLLSWRNTFMVDVFGELGSAHIHGLCKWGPSSLTLRRRTFPSGRPEEEVYDLQSADPTWAAEYTYFKELCARGGTNIDNDLWINAVLNGMARSGETDLQG